MTIIRISTRGVIYSSYAMLYSRTEPVKRQGYCYKVNKKYRYQSINQKEQSKLKIQKTNYNMK